MKNSLRLQHSGGQTIYLQRPFNCKMGTFDAYHTPLFPSLFPVCHCLIKGPVEEKYIFIVCGMFGHTEHQVKCLLSVIQIISLDICQVFQ